MTHDHRNDEAGHAHDHPDEHGHDHDQHAHDEGRADETRPVERNTNTYVERTVDRGYVPPPQPAVAPPVAPAGGQVNVNPAGTTYAEPVRGPLYYARRVLSLLFAVLAVLLALRIVLLALVANQQNDIVDFVYGVTEPFVGPFRGIFQFETVTPGGGSILDIAAVVAFVGWMLVYLLLMAILSLADRDRTA